MRLLLLQISCVVLHHKQLHLCYGCLPTQLARSVMYNAVDVVGT